VIVAPTIHTILNILLIGSGLAFFWHYKRESKNNFPSAAPKARM